MLFYTTLLLWQTFQEKTLKDPEVHTIILIGIPYRSNIKINPPVRAKVATLVKVFNVEKPTHGADSVKIVCNLSRKGRSSVAASQYQIQVTCLREEISPDNQTTKLPSRINQPNPLHIPNIQKHLRTFRTKQKSKIFVNTWCSPVCSFKNLVVVIFVIVAVPAPAIIVVIPVVIIIILIIAANFIA